MADEEGAAPPAEGEAAPSPSQAAPPPSGSLAAVPAGAGASRASVPRGSQAAVPAGSRASVPAGSQVAVPPAGSKVAVEPSPSKAGAAEAAPSPSKAAAAPAPSKVDAAPTPSKVDAAPTPSKVDAAPTPSKVEAAPTPSKVEAGPAPSKAEAAPQPSKVAAGEGPKVSEKPSKDKMERRSRSKMSITQGSRISVLAGQKGIRTSSKQSLISARESLMRVRPASKAWQRSGSFLSFRRSSLGFDKMKAMYENSYVLGPKTPFSSDKVDIMLRELLEGEEISYPESYTPESAHKLSHDVAAQLRACLKDLQFDRYRLVCLCEVVDNRGQTAAHGMRFLWDAERDNFACYTVEKMYYYMTVSVFGVYTD